MKQLLIIAFVFMLFSSNIFSQPTGPGKPKSNILFKLYDGSFEIRLGKTDTNYYKVRLFKGDIQDIIYYSHTPFDIYGYGIISCDYFTKSKLVITKTSNKKEEKMKILLENIPAGYYLILYVKFKKGTYLINYREQFDGNKYIILNKNSKLFNITPYKWENVKIK